MSSYTNDLDQPIGAPIENWQPRQLPARTNMSGSHCSLELLDPDKHAAELFNAYIKATDPRDWTYLPYGPFDSAGEFDSWLRDSCTKDDPLFHAIIASDSNTAVGVASYLRIEPAVGVIEVGHIHYSPSMQRTPIATEAMFLMMQRVFDELGYRRYEWKCDALNTRSRQAALRLGFKFEGVFRNATMYKGRNRDTAWFSIIDSEWPALKVAYLKWLHADNFDTEGKQRVRLGELIK